MSAHPGLWEVCWNTVFTQRDVSFRNYVEEKNRKSRNSQNPVTIKGESKSMAFLSKDLIHKPDREFSVMT